MVQKVKGGCGEEDVPDWNLISSTTGSLTQASLTDSWGYLQVVLIL